MEFRELSHSPSVDVIVHPEGFEIDEASQKAINSTKSIKLVVDTMMKYMDREPTGAPHRIHIHLCQSPVAVLGTDAVEGLRTERTELIGDGTVRGTGEFTDWPVQAVYRAVGYLSSHLADLPFDHHAGVVPNDAGRVLDADWMVVDATYVTGWIKRGPIGLIGHTKSDAAETVASLLADLPGIRPPEVADPDAILGHLSANNVDYTTWAEWERLDAHEAALGAEQGRERVKVVPRADMIRAGRG
jgi:ferredoxin--NADP+ reductase